MKYVATNKSFKHWRLYEATTTQKCSLFCSL